MPQNKCKSNLFPCPAGENCPDHKQLLAMIQNKDFDMAREFIFKQKIANPYSQKNELLPQKITTPDAIVIRTGLFEAPSRTYGERLIEPLVRKIFGLQKPTNGDYDALDSSTGLKYEIKASKVLKTNEVKAEVTLFDTIANQAASSTQFRIISFNDRKAARYGANIQNVKRDHFDFLIYVLLFEEGIEFFKTPKALINKKNIPNWSDKHGRYDELGKSGQFNINRGNIEEHEKKSLTSFFTYEELVPFCKELNEKTGN